MAEPTAADYRRLIVDARRQQLQLTRENVNRLAQTYDKAAQNVVAQLDNVPGYMLTAEGGVKQAYYRTLLLNIDRVLTDLWADYGKTLDVTLLDIAQNTADREAQVESLMTSSAAKDPRLIADMTRTQTLSSGATLTASFGRVAEDAVQAVTTRIYRDGLQLSQRLYQLDAGARTLVENTLIQGIAEQVSAKELADRLQTALSQAGRQTPKYNAMRIARTEINHAHREAHIRSVMNPDGVMKPYVLGVRWHLSLSHPEPDICDVWAAHDEGLGAGVYQPGSVPVDHPHGLCYVTTELRAFPGVRGPGMKPDVGAVPESQVAYYARQGDAPSAALIGAAT